MLQSKTFLVLFKIKIFLALGNDKVLVAGDFNLNYEKENDPFKFVFMNVLESIGYKQNVTGPTHYCIHTLDLILSLGVDVRNAIVHPNNPIL